MIGTITWSVFSRGCVGPNKCWWSTAITDTSVNFLLLLPANSSCNTVMEHCVIPPHVSWGCAEYAMVRAAKNVHSFFQRPGTRMSWSHGVFGRRKTKSSSRRRAFQIPGIYFLFRTFFASLLSINRKRFILFACWVHISGVIYYDGKRQVSRLRLKE